MKVPRIGTDFHALPHRRRAITMVSQTGALANATTLAKTSTVRATIAVVQREVSMIDHIE